jgi:hypothetical protein
MQGQTPQYERTTYAPNIEWKSMLGVLVFGLGNAPWGAR